MSTEAAQAATETSQRGLITAVLVLAAMIYALDWTIASVALPHMQGTFSATQDQIAWVLTSYIVLSAIMLPVTGWLSMRIGRKRLFLVSIGGFTIFSILCGAADSLTTEVFFRIGQGAFGAFLIPMSQAIMLDIYAPQEHAKAMALWAMGVILGPVIGPTLGGYLTETYTWRWVFYINVPIGVLAYLGAKLFLPESMNTIRKSRFDWTGFASLALGIGALQMILDRGERQGWFESTEIMLEAAVMVAGLYIFAVQSLTGRQPIVNLRLLKDRNYALGLIFTLLYGLLTLAPIVLMPPFLQHLQDYPVVTIGMMLSPRGAGLMIAMMVLGRVGQAIDTRLLIGTGFLLLGISSWSMSGWNLEVDTWSVVWTGLMQGLGAGAIILRLSVVTFETLDPMHRTETASMWNLIRSLGSAVGISVAMVILARQTGANHATLVEYVSPYNPLFAYTDVAGPWNLRELLSLAGLEGEISRQAAMIGYIDVFRLFSITSFLAIPLIVFLGKRR